MSDLNWRWTWLFAATPAELWPVVSDTDRFNRLVGLPPVEFRSIPISSATSGKGVRREGRCRMFGMNIVWQEHPFRFEEPRWFSVLREYRAGPVREIETRTEFIPRPAGGTELVYSIRATPRGWLGALIARIQIGVFTFRSFDRAFRRFGDSLRAGAPPYATRPALDESYRARFEEALGDVKQKERLLGHLLTAPDFELVKMRPFRFAREWAMPRNEVLGVFLHATRKGVLDASWSLICPSCRGRKEEARTLRDLKFDAHCDACNIKFTADFDKFTELTFGLAPRWRDIRIGDYCVGGPGRMPHVAAQLVVAPGAIVESAISLAQGSYYVRSQASGGLMRLRVESGGAAEVPVVITKESLGLSEAAVSGEFKLKATNRLSVETNVALERTAWADEVCTAAHAAANQDFRDLFDSEVLAAGTSVKISSVTILFTDLKDSTAMYGRTGDARAFGLVQRHFEVLEEVVREHSGAIVKTIGDAVMAVFLEPVLALKAGMAMHERVTRLVTPDEEPVVLKIGFHAGPCFAVTQNDNLDYFGSTVNLAARIQGAAQGNDVVLEADLARSIGARNMYPALSHEEFDANLKGITGTRQLVRIVARSGSGP